MVSVQNEYVNAGQWQYAQRTRDCWTKGAEMSVFSALFHDVGCVKICLCLCLRIVGSPYTKNRSIMINQDHSILRMQVQFRSMIPKQFVLAQEGGQECFRRPLPSRHVLP